MAEIEGAKELSKKLAALGALAGGKALRSAVGAAATPIKKEAESNIPTGKKAHKTYKGRLVAPGFASRNIVKRTRLYRNRQTAVAVVGVRREAFYAVQFVELGTKKLKARPWLVRSMKNKQREAERRFARQLKRRILKVANQ